MTGPDVRVHPTAIVEQGVVIGAGTSVWDNVHLRAPSEIGRDCIIGEKTYVAYGVRIGDRCKLNAFVYVCTGVTLGTGVMLAAGVTFTNDRFPRATTADLADLRPSDPDEHTEHTDVGDGTTIGARAVIGPGLTLGRFSMVGMGSVVTRDVPDHCLVTGSPARVVGLVARDGTLLCRAGDKGVLPETTLCGPDGWTYQVRPGNIVTSAPTATSAPAGTAGGAVLGAQGSPA